VRNKKKEERIKY